MSSLYTRPQAAILAARLAESRRFLQAVPGPRQVGNTTLVQGVVEASGLPVRSASADEPTLRDPAIAAVEFASGRFIQASTP